MRAKYGAIVVVAILYPLLPFVLPVELLLVAAPVVVVGPAVVWGLKGGLPALALAATALAFWAPSLAPGQWIGPAGAIFASAVVGLGASMATTAARRNERALLDGQTALAQAKAALEEQEQRFRQLLDLCLDIVLVHDGERVVYANPAAAGAFGAASPRELLGQEVTALIPPGEAGKKIEELVSAGEQRAVSLGQVSCERLDGRPSRRKRRPHRSSSPASRRSTCRLAISASDWPPRTPCWRTRRACGRY
jgi:PAS domain S-box-containing protein